MAFVWRKTKLSSVHVTYKSSAPSNIALIKYMGKTQVHGNRPSNPSLSYTLPKLLSFVEVEGRTSEELSAEWQPLLQYEKLLLSEKGLSKFLAHFKSILSQFDVTGHFIVRSGNNFPSACGIASSASSFAALTKAACQIVSELKGKSFTDLEMSVLSQKGSGSSCRSFFPEWALWRDEGAKPLDFKIKSLQHDVVVVSNEEKEVSSSEAHKRVMTSLLFAGRVERAQLRLSDLTLALNESNWRQVFETVWAEFWDMHALFETSQPSFGYMNSGSFAVLDWARNLWLKHDDGPLVTMDAGPNVHLLWRQDQTKLRASLSQTNWKIWSGT